MRSFWRCFPYDPDAPDGAPYSPSYLVPGQTVGRFDLRDRPPVRYLADLPEHAVGETLSPFRATTFRPAYLRLQGHPLALVEVTLAERVLDGLADCTDPKVLDRLALRPDELAHHDRTLTQAIARRIHDHGDPPGAHTGLRWWSALTGAWHTTVLFTDRVGAGDVAFGEPRPLVPHDPTVVRARLVLGIRAH